MKLTPFDVRASRKWKRHWAVAQGVYRYSIYLQMNGF